VTVPKARHNATPKQISLKFCLRSIDHIKPKSALLQASSAPPIAQNADPITSSPTKEQTPTISHQSNTNTPMPSKYREQADRAK